MSTCVCVCVCRQSPDLMFVKNLKHTYCTSTKVLSKQKNPVQKFQYLQPTYPPTPINICNENQAHEQQNQFQPHTGSII